MMKNEHTPGSWHVSGGAYVNAGLNRVAKVDFAWQTDKEQMANLLLIAAAPDLLAALEQCLKLVNAYRHVSGGDGDISAMNARAAIAKARGE